MDTVSDIALLTQFYGIAFISVAFYLFFGLTLLAQNQGKRYAVFGALAQVIMIVFDLAFYRILGIYTFSIALFISHALMAIVMYLNLDIQDKKGMTFYILRYMLLLVLLIITQVMFSQYFLSVHIILKVILHGCLLCISLPIFAVILGFDLKQYILLIKMKMG